MKPSQKLIAIAKDALVERRLAEGSKAIFFYIFDQGIDDFYLRSQQYEQFIANFLISRWGGGGVLSLPRFSSGGAQALEPPS